MWYKKSIIKIRLQIYEVWGKRKRKKKKMLFSLLAVSGSMSEATCLKWHAGCRPHVIYWILAFLYKPSMTIHWPQRERHRTQHTLPFHFHWQWSEKSCKIGGSLFWFQLLDPCHWGSSIWILEQRYTGNVKVNPE